MPTVDIPDKICSHCGGTKWFVVYQTYKDKVYTVHTCTIRKKEKEKNWISENRERRCLIHKRSKDKVKHTEDYIIKNRKRAAEYYKKYPEKVYAHSKSSRLKDPEKYNNRSKLKKREYVKTLDDVYIKSLLCDNTRLSYNEIPQELIKLKRKQLLLKRQIKDNG